MKPSPKQGRELGKPSSSALVEHRDFYYEETAMVFTAAYHLRRGYCCGNGCRHCPYGHIANSTVPLSGS
ncbi:MAG: DUF5522 domain-containing protein [Steroidobacteraceae bacterium]